MSKITKATIRMYRMGTGDCFIIKFFAGDKPKFNMMIDCGTWMGGKGDLSPYIEDLKEYVGSHINLLVITHEHKDHVHLFDVCKELLTQKFTVDRLWMGWTEDDKKGTVQEWKKNYGDKKKALAIAANKLEFVLSDALYCSQMAEEYNGMAVLEARQKFAGVVSNFNDLQGLSVEGKYVGMLAGMKVIKENFVNDKTEYLKPGTVIENLPNLEGIKFYVLAPPVKWESVKKETGGKGESYDHNKEVAEDQAFSAAVLANDNSNSYSALPFDSQYVLTDTSVQTVSEYQNEAWRKIDNDWLFNAGNLALRINSITNNLSLALAIEFEESGRVMLFPGDAEYGSWASWHAIDWSEVPRNGKQHFTEDLLSRTVFYKVAHHLSHHGTAERLGMQMMTHPDLVAMATLDYDVISSSWKGTMPNRPLLKALLTQTKGRLMVMNEKGLYYDTEGKVPLSDKIKEYRKRMNEKDLNDFITHANEDERYYIEFTVRG